MRQNSREFYRQMEMETKIEETDGSLSGLPTFSVEKRPEKTNPLGATGQGK